MKKSFKLGRVLVFSMVGLLFLAVLFTGLSSYFSSRRVFLSHARDIMANISSYTIDKAHQHLQPAKDAAALTSALAVNEIVNRADMDEMESYFYEQLSLYNQFSGIYYANIAGDFIMASRYGNEESPYLTKIISHINYQRQVQVIHRDESLAETFSFYDEEDQYDPRVRPWFIEAATRGELIWTDPYIFFTSQNPGITTAVPVYSALGEMTGVVGVDIEISQLSEFIATLKVGERGRAFILNSQGMVIAYPDQEAIRQTKENSDGFRMINISELDDPVARWTYQEYHSRPDLDPQETNFLSFNYQGENYHAMLTPFQVSRWPWTLIIYLPEDDYIGALKDNRSFNLIISLAAALLCSLLGFAITRTITQPMLRLTKAAQRVETQDFSSVAEVPSRYWEIQVASSAFESMRLALLRYQNHMEELVSTRTEELQASNAQLAKTIEELELTQADLKKARVQAERANEAKSSFLATMSHEIRTPLAGILGFAEMIEQTDISDTAQTYVATIIQESNRLSRLINGLLDLAKIEAGELHLERGPIKLEELVRSVVLLVRPRADEKDLECSFTLSPQVPEVVIGDSLRLSQILLNLLSNAVKFTHQGAVHLDVQAENVSARDFRLTFSVSDTGIGIPEDRVAAIFEEYTQASSSTARVYGGTGLGLPIANRLVQLMGGSLEVLSQAGEGTRFYFSLLMQEDKNPLKDPKLQWEYLRDKMKGLRILSAEDSPTNRDILSFHLSKAGAICDFVENGKEALEQFRRKDYDMVILDLNMPVMGGLEAASKIRSENNEIPLVAVTAHATQQDVQDCLNNGFTDCLVKPYTAKGLIRCLAQWV